MRILDGATGGQLVVKNIGAPIDPFSVEIGPSSVYVGTFAVDDQGLLAAIEIRSGNSWTTPLPGSIGDPAVTPTAIFVAATHRRGEQRGTVHAVAASNGSILWSFPTEAEVRTKPIVVDGLAIFVASAVVHRSL